MTCAPRLRHAAAAAALLCVALPARADNTPTGIEWPGWYVTSTEALWRGRKHTSYPLTYLLDGNPATAWVFSGTQPDEMYGARHALWFAPAKPVTLDSIRIMNGYNKSRETFLRNNRVTRMTVIVDGKKVAAPRLPDRMGWHTVKLPRRTVRHSFVLQFTGMKKGPDNDLCISEVQFYNRDRKIDLRLPQVLLQSDGGEAVSQTARLIRRDGRKLATHEREPMVDGGGWSPDGRYVTGIEFLSEGGTVLWIADAVTGRMVLRQRLKVESDSPGFTLKWQGSRTVSVLIDHNRTPNDVKEYRYRVP